MEVAVAGRVAWPLHPRSGHSQIESLRQSKMRRRTLSGIMRKIDLRKQIKKREVLPIDG